MDINSTTASQNIARTQAKPVQRNEGQQAAGQTQGAAGAVSVSVTGESRQASELGESVNDNLSGEEALALAGSIAEQLATANLQWRWSEWGSRRRVLSVMDGRAGGPPSRV